MTKIEPHFKIINIEYEDIKENIFVLLQKLLYDFNQNMTDELFEHSYRKLAVIIKNQYKSLSWIDIESVFDGISSGLYDMKKISVTNIMLALNDYIKKKRELNKIALEKQEYEQRQNIFADMAKEPRGKAILFRMEQREKGEFYWEQFPQAEIAQKIVSGEIQYQYISDKRITGRKFNINK